MGNENYVYCFLYKSDQFIGAYFLFPSAARYIIYDTAEGMKEFTVFSNLQEDQKPIWIKDLFSNPAGFTFPSLSSPSDQRLDEAYAKFRDGNVDEAIEKLQQAIVDAPEDGLAHLMLAFCYTSLENEKDARIEFDKALDYGKKDPRVHSFIGDYYEATGEYEKAIDSFSLTIQLSPKDPETYLDLASLYVEHTGQLREARSALEKCLKLNPPKETLIKAYMMLAAASETDYEQEKYYKKVLKIDPDNAEAKTLLRFLKMDYKDNIAIIAEAEEHFIKAENLFEAYKFEQAIEEYMKVIEKEPTFAKAYLYLGDCHWRLQRPENAFPYFQRAVELDPENPQAWAFLGDAYIRFEDYKSGYKCYKNAVDLDPKYYKAVEKLKEVEKLLEIARQ